MNLNDLHWAVVVGREGSLSAACATLGISPGTLSKAIARIERSTRVKLFERMARGMRPTAFGAAFLRRAAQMDLAAEDLFAELRDLRQAHAGVVRVGVGNGLPDRWVRPVVQALVTRGISVELSGGMTDSLKEAALRGELDFAVLGQTGAPSQGLSWRVLTEDPMQPMAPKGHAMARPRRSVPWSELAQARWIVTGRPTATFREFEANFAARGNAAPVPSVLSSSSGREFLLCLALDAILLMPRSAVREPEVQARLASVSPVGGWSSRRELGIIWRTGAYVGPGASLAMELFEKHIQSPAKG